jgi:hypothetical protein
MKPFDDDQIIRIILADHAEPGGPWDMDKEAIKKLGTVPKVVQSFVDLYGSRLGSVTMRDGCIIIAIHRDQDLFGLDDTSVADIVLTAEEVKSNSTRQPPLALSQAVTHPHCLDLVRALSQSFAKTGLIVSLVVAGKADELPHIPPANFTEPEDSCSAKRHLRAKVSGVCKPNEDANIILLGDKTFLELPAAYYPYNCDKMYELAIKCDTVFIGAAELIGKGAYRALPGGELLAQPPL